jgi:Ca2+-binding RTX toxin-like protein
VIEVRKTVLVSATMALAVLLVSGLALAAPKGGDTTTTIYCAAGTSCQGTGGPDIIYGTSAADVIIPYAGDDEVYAYGGNDEVRHGFGKDTIYGGSGADTLRGGFDHDTIYGNQPSPTDPKADTSDSARDLIDCAYIASRKDLGPDVGYGSDNDTVVDCSNRDDQ